MSHESQAIDRIAATRRPEGRPIGYHHWSNLLFVHWCVPAEMVQPLLPEGLTLDTWQGHAWVGLVPFYMSRIRPWWSPPVPGISWFCETNVRTYVHRDGRDPGVWFFSLDASKALAVLIARWRWNLPYYRAHMRLTRVDRRVEYFSTRRGCAGAPPGAHIRAQIGELLGHGDSRRPLPPGQALPGTLEHFLIERYILYAQSGSGELLSGRVYHSPYPIREARLESCEGSLVAATGIAPIGSAAHVAFSEGVAVEIFRLTSAGAHDARCAPT
jgi:uncharacterized protein